ncbi:hypothetical protein BC833DRAFT_525477 [Globomyces pollinis-pini]|nr:hypothetical protein BC833DRAFT_525477 [Globomyces pollinis-pini]
MFQNASMKQRENRLQAARTDAKRSIRELKRDRNELERVEKQLMTQLRMQIKRGDLPKAQMIATTIGHYRNVSDRNFARSIWIQAQSQGMSFVNGVESVDSMRARTTKYHHRKDEVETIESILNEGFDDIYEEIESEQINPVFFDAQVAAIIKEAQDAKLKMRDYGSQNTDMISKV